MRTAKIADVNRIPISRVYREIDREMERQTPKKPFGFAEKMKNKIRQGYSGDKGWKEVCSHMKN